MEWFCVYCCVVNSSLLFISSQCFEWLEGLLLRVQCYVSRHFIGWPMWYLESPAVFSQSSRKKLIYYERIYNIFPKALNVPWGEAEGNIEVEGKQNSLFPEGPVIKCFDILPDSNTGKKTAKKWFACRLWTVRRLCFTVRAAVKPSFATKTTQW